MIFPSSAGPVNARQPGQNQPRFLLIQKPTTSTAQQNTDNQQQIQQQPTQPIYVIKGNHVQPANQQQQVNFFIDP